EDPWEYFDPTVPDWANDLRLMYPGRGYWVLVSEAVTLEIRNQGPPPAVAIASPADLAVVTEPTEILGTVESDLLESWTLTSVPVGDGDPVTLATSAAPVASGALATFDPTLLLNGLYELELKATDVQGQQVSASVVVTVEGQMKIGHFTLSFVDLAIPVSGLDIEVIRTYDSRDRQPLDFGAGWHLDIRQGSYRNNRPPGDGWQLKTGFLPCDTVLESKSHLTVVRLSDQEVYRFALRLQDGTPSTGGGCFATTRFDFVDGPLPGTTLEILGQTQVFYENSSDRVIDVDTLETYEPQDVRLTTRDGRIFEFDLIDGVTLVEDLNGNQLSITPAGITHSSGKGIVFDRDAEGRITAISDPMDRSMSYGYDAAGDLGSFTDRAGATTRFTYDSDHRLLDIEDPRGVKPIRNEYDAEGRLIRHIDAFGKVIELGHDLDNRREVVTNRLGASRILEYDDRGNVVRETDELGKVTVRSFDGRDNLLAETDPLGRTTAYTYTSDDDLATLTDPLGNVTAYTYDSRAQLLTVTDSRRGMTANVYDSRGNLTQTTDAQANVTTFTYDAAGNLLATTDALGNVTSFQYESVGNQTRETDALGHETLLTYDEARNRLTEIRSRTLGDGTTETLVTTFAYDDLDRLTSTTAADGSTTTTTYDLLGKVNSRTDPLDRVTTMTYDLMGRLTATTHPDGNTETQTYDDEGRLFTQSDRAGRTTTFAYDAAGRLVSSTFPDGASTSSTYDAAGQFVATTDARGNTTTFTYDAAGRRAAVIDRFGNGPTFTYDANGNQTTVTDARGKTTTFAYGELNRLTVTTHPDGTTIEVGYDALGRRVAEVDQAGLTTAFGYDALGRLTSVTDALSQVTAYTYDEVGNRLTQADANGRTTRFDYDPLGRQIARIFPDGSRETMAYNADGTLASHTDFNGNTRTFGYDAAQRLTNRTYPDSSAVTFTYTATGQRASVTDSRGTTSYTYDDRDRLLTKTDPTGHNLAYNYDLQGNRTSLTATVGTEVLTTSYSYDDLNRLESVTDSQGGVTTLAYDANGNRASLAFPNSVTTDYTYDDLNRLTTLKTATGVGDIVQSSAFTLGAAGNRTRIDEHDGTSRHYVYDDLYRLTQDRVTDASSTQIYQRDFVYDPVGNRTEQTLDEGGGATTIASTYDDRGRLLTAAATSYGWDTNGNLASQDGTSYAWDYENRLTSVSLADGTLVETTYDADGNRVRTSVTPAGGGAATVDYLVDTTGFLSHVVADVVSGWVQTLYTRADDQLIGLYRPGSGASQFYHVDGLGSVRVLSDEAGGVAGRYSYTAFGELLEQEGSDLQPYQFAGEPFDPNVGFYYNRARWLDVASGRFASEDPFGGILREPLTLHRYLYANVDPVDLVDPSGRLVSGASLASFAIAGAINGILVAINPIMQGEGIVAIGKAFAAGFAIGVGGAFLGLGLIKGVARLFQAIPYFKKIRFIRLIFGSAHRVQGTQRFGGQAATPECVKCSIDIAQKLGLSEELISGGFRELASSGKNGIINVFGKIPNLKDHFVVKFGNKIYDRTILANIRSQFRGGLSNLPRNLERSLQGLQGVDTFPAEQYAHLRRILYFLLRQQRPG
ncbi:MAG: RHS repeat protein, partial [Actinomycetia bacterium]|nr:RHS repeat protein [Actinomycetes bacterium]